MNPFKTCIASVVVAFTTLTALAPAHGQARSDAPIKLVVPFAPGGSTDLVARVLVEKVSRVLGEPVIVENRAGAGGDIGSAYVAKSVPDGKTLLLNGTAPLSIGMASGRNLNFNPMKDLSPIGIVTEVPNVVAVNPGLPVQTVAELVAYAKANPGKLSYGMSAVGNLSQFNAEMFAAAAGIKLVGIAYKGTGPQITDLIGGTIQLSFDNLPPFLPQIKAGRLRALAVTSAHRSPLLPDVPALAEVGFPGFDHPARFAIFGPTGLPQKTIARYNDAFSQAARDPEIAKRLSDIAVEPAPGTPEQLGTRLKEERDVFARIIQSAGLKFE
ncbi:MAG: tripartite tricarboxylate transporter substrate binding protein [Variovorax sp.]|nr:tripartite tricarboxylate transporter substrate binding protein [Variovorax sp.]